MALMDIISLSSDKQAVVLDIGHSYTKLGFAGESSPRHIIASEVRHVKNGSLEVRKFYQPDSNEDEMFELYREFLHMVYFKYLLVNPKERRVVVCESMFESIQVRNVLAKVLFKHFEVVSVVFAPSHIVALFALGLKSGLVVDCGFEESSVVPVFEQTPILASAQFLSLAGKELHQHIYSQLHASGAVQTNPDSSDGVAPTAAELTDGVLEDIKVRCCFVGRHGCYQLAKDVQYPMNGGKLLRVGGQLRAHAFDILFNGDEEDRSLCTIMLDAIASCPIDCRRTLAENIVLIGGTSMTPGFENRIFEEINYLLESSSYGKKIKVKNIRIKRPPIPANFCAWQGGAIFGALEILGDHSISRERYHVNSSIPDWSSILALPKDASDKNELEDSKYKWSSFRKSLSQGMPSALGTSLSSPTIKSDIDALLKNKSTPT